MSSPTPSNEGRLRSLPLDLDAYTHSVLQHLDPEVLRSLTPGQVEAFVAAIAAEKRARRHRLDLRLSIPLIFRRYYVVLLAGRDVRRATRQSEAERRRHGALAGGLFLIGLALVLLLGPLLLYILYEMKCGLDINFLPDKHAWDVLRDFLT